MKSILSYFKRKEKEGYLPPKIFQQWKTSGKAFVLIDERTIEEFHERHIPDAIVFPVQIIETHFQSHFPNRNQTYVLYCRSGIRSYHALVILKNMGYKDVYDMGGIIHYPYETIDPKLGV